MLFRISHALLLDKCGWWDVSVLQPGLYLCAFIRINFPNFVLDF